LITDFINFQRILYLTIGKVVFKPFGHFSGMDVIFTSIDNLRMICALKGAHVLL